MAKKKGAHTLVVVESPSKAKTIHKYLGDDYVIASSVGHIIDLPKSRLAIDVENGFSPEYITIRGKAKVLNELRRKAKSVDTVLLATDPDREGEAISWHLERELSKKNPNIKRIEFNEITESAIRDAIHHPRAINMDLVNAQQARRILDRIVGYYISPLLWKNIKRGLSAGRVQSVALRVICDREEEIERFVPQEYWTIDTRCTGKGKDFEASVTHYNDEKLEIASEDAMNDHMKRLEKASFQVQSIKTQERKRKPLAPYITSKLQQDAANRLGFTSRKTMMVAQQLYEGIDVTGEGPMGLITYMRTDSTRLSPLATESVRQYIADNFSSEYLPEKPNVYGNRKGAQDAHEAIRPTSVLRTPDSLKGDLTRDQFRLYDMIWRRFVSSQMTPEVSEAVTMLISGGDYTLRATGRKILFKGFTAVEGQSKKEKEASKTRKLPPLSEGDMVTVEEFLPEQHFTTPPPRFNDASLVKFLEESGIGRPSTYAPTVETIIKRYYIQRKGRQLVPTVLGKLVNGVMKEHFADLVNVDFTAKMESELDAIEESEKEWKSMLEEFYGPFHEVVAKAEENIEEMKGILDEETDIECEKCGKPMMKKLGKYGFFLACSGFPECRNARSLPLGKCPDCETGDVVKRQSRKGRGNFYACNNYPECEFLTRETPAERACPQCGSLLFQRKIKGKGFKQVCLKEGCGYELDLPDEE